MFAAQKIYACSVKAFASAMACQNVGGEKQEMHGNAQQGRIDNRQCIFAEVSVYVFTIQQRRKGFHINSCVHKKGVK
jgi:hypothetical protein